MAKKLKRAFTIVELVIVIAVIAILAAVLIPTFTTLIDKANQSADTSNVKNMNSILAMDETTNGKPKTMDDAVKVIREGGYDLEKLTPTGQGYDIVWDQDANRLLMVNGNEVIFGETEKNADNTHLWVVVDSVEKIAATGYSVYLTDAVSGAVKAAQGVDVGANEDITTVTYETSVAQDVTIRTNGGALEVNAAEATVAHYDAAASVDIQAVADHSYHEYGTVAGNITLKQGRFVAEDNSSAAALIVTATDVNAVEIVINDTTKTWSIAAENETVAGGLKDIVSGNTANAEIVNGAADTQKFAGGVGTENSPYLIENEEQFLNIGSFSEQMGAGNAYHFKLLNDIDLRNTDVSVAVSSYICGGLDGNGKTLIASDLLKYIFADANGEVTIKDLNYKMVTLPVMVVGGMKVNAEGVKDNSLTYDNVDMYTVDANVAVELGANGGLYTANVGQSELTQDWCDNNRNKLLIQNCDAYVNISGTSYNGVFIGGQLNNTDAVVRDCTYNASYYGVTISLIYGNTNSSAGAWGTYGKSTFAAYNVKNNGSMYGTEALPGLVKNESSMDSFKEVTVENCDIGLARELKDSKLSLEKDTDGNLVITEASTPANYYMLSIVGGTRRLTQATENSSYTFRIKLSAEFVNGKFNSGYKDGKLATVAQYKESVDAEAVFDDADAIQVFGEEGAKFWVKENNGVVYYVFEFSDDFYYFESNNEKAIVDINSAAVIAYDEQDLPIAQYRLDLNK